LTEILETLDALGLAESFDVDFGDAGGLDYYTGLTFKVYVHGSGAEVGGGGRYDNLIGSFGAAEPAIGFSLSLDGLVGALGRRRDEKVQTDASDPTAVVRKNDDFVEVFRRAMVLRSENEKVRVDNGDRNSAA
jgi:ATP phosphoribosyltransferase regulatory subunit